MSITHLLPPSAIVAVTALHVRFGQGEGITDFFEDRPVAFLIVGLLAIVLIVLGLVRRLVKLVVLAAVVGIIAWYFYFAPPGG